VSTVQDIFGIYIFAFILSFLMYISTVTMKGKDGRLQSTAFFRFLSAIAMSMPAGVPAVMIFCIVVALQRLRGRGITALYPGQLKMAANVDIACFDKTGTLTGSEVRGSACPDHAL
jgi:P-type E1-E2 ATPase